MSLKFGLAAPQSSLGYAKDGSKLRPQISHEVCLIASENSACRKSQICLCSLCYSCRFTTQICSELLQKCFKTTSLSLSRNGPQNKPGVHFRFGFVHLKLASDLPQSCLRSTTETASKTPQDCLRFIAVIASDLPQKLGLKSVVKSAVRAPSSCGSPRGVSPCCGLLLRP
jgi:hypothetical protein